MSILAVWCLCLPFTQIAAVDPAMPDCSLNGKKQSDSTCKCAKGWTGQHCGQFDFVPAAPLDKQVTPAAAMTINNSIAWQTWGMSVIGPIKGVYHGYTTEIANECALGLYGVASTVIHMEASSPTGPWKKNGVALPAFAHNPQAILLPNGSVALYHIGTSLPEECVGNCTEDKTTHGLNPDRNDSCPGAWDVSHSASVAVADNPAGPFRRFPYIFGTRGPTNPAPLLLKNGTILVAARRSCGTSIPLYSAPASTPEGPYQTVHTSVTASTDLPWRMISEEDPFFYQESDGSYHLLWHRSWLHNAASVHDGRCGGGHTYSADGNHFFIGEATYGKSSSPDAQCNLTWANGTQGNLTSRQRPTLFDDMKTGRRYLFNGASAFVDMYVHSFTLVQEVNMNVNAAVELV